MSAIPEGIKVLFIAGFGPVVTNRKQSEHLYKELLQLPLETADDYDGYMHSQNIDGIKYFALWPLDKVALSCFGTPEWPEDLPVPQAWLEFDVADIESATEILKQNGYKILTHIKKEPWGQIVTRFLSPEGLVMAVGHTPLLREETEKK